MWHNGCYRSVGLEALKTEDNMRTPHIPLTATLLAEAAGIAVAQEASTYDATQLSETRGKVAGYSQPRMVTLTA